MLRPFRFIVLSSLELSTWNLLATHSSLSFAPYITMQDLAKDANGQQATVLPIATSICRSTVLFNEKESRNTIPSFLFSVQGNPPTEDLHQDRTSFACFRLRVFSGKVPANNSTLGQIRLEGSKL